MRLDHIGIAVNDLSESEPLFRRLLGQSNYKRETVAGQQVTTSFFKAGAADSKVELVAPLGGDSNLRKFLDKRGPGIHHLAFEVDDIEVEMQRLATDGFELLQASPTRGADNKLICFLHPRSTGGILVEICQSIPPKSNAAYWSDRYKTGATGWDAGSISTPIKAYLDQLTDRDLRILLPGAGHAHEAEYAWRQGFRQLTVLDIAPEPLQNLRQRVPDFPEANIVEEDFFAHEGAYDLIIEQTFFCSFPPTAENRSAYAQKMHDLLVPGGKLVGLFFDFPIDQKERPPFGGSRSEYLSYFNPLFEVLAFQTAHNSIQPRAGRELFGILRKRL